MKSIAREGPVLRAAAFLVMTVIVTVVAVQSWRFPANDFRVYWRAGARFLAAAELYRQDGYPYRYAPGVAALFAPLALASFGAARAVWIALTVALVLATAALVHASTSRRRWFAAPIAVLCLIRPLSDELQNGQVDVMALACVVAAYWLSDDGRDGTAGALLALAAGLKVVPILAALEWVASRRWRAMMSLGLGLAALAALPAARYGIGGALELHLGWLRSELASAPSMMTTAGVQSVWGIAMRWGFGRVVATTAVVALIAAAISTREDALRRALLLLAIPLVTTYGWIQCFVFAIPLVALLLAGPPKIGWSAVVLSVITAIASYDVIGRRWEDWAEGRKLTGFAMLALFVLGRVSASRIALASSAPPPPAPASALPRRGAAPFDAAKERR